MANISKQIKTLRKEFGLSANQLAEKSVLSPAFISKLEDNQYASLKLSTCKSLAEGFGITLQEFLEKVGILESNKSRPSLQLIREAWRKNGYSSEQVEKIMDHAELLRKASRDR